MFLVNSRLGHFSAPNLRWVPLSRSYGVNLPSSLAVIHSSALGYSPRPPVSVCGTGLLTLRDRELFSRVGSPALSDHPKALGTVRYRHPCGCVPPFNRQFRLTAAVSLPGHSLSCQKCCGILNAYPSGSPLGCPLGPGLPWYG